MFADGKLCMMNGYRQRGVIWCCTIPLTVSLLMLSLSSLLLVNNDSHLFMLATKSRWQSSYCRCRLDAVVGTLAVLVRTASFSGSNLFSLCLKNLPGGFSRNYLCAL